ncbi:MAG: DUF4235 domain-containing protein [Actinomycetes bacterium]
MADAGVKVGWRIFGGIAGVAAAIAARKALTTSWKVATGKEPPDTPESPDTSWTEAIGWAVLSGTVVALARLAATRSAAATWARSTGSLPPGFEADVTT